MSSRLLAEGGGPPWYHSDTGNFMPTGAKGKWIDGGRYQAMLGMAPRTYAQCPLLSAFRFSTDSLARYHHQEAISPPIWPILMLPHSSPDSVSVHCIVIAICGRYLAGCRSGIGVVVSCAGSRLYPLVSIPRYGPKLRIGVLELSSHYSTR